MATTTEIEEVKKMIDSFVSVGYEATMNPEDLDYWSVDNLVLHLKTIGDLKTDAQRAEVESDVLSLWGFGDTRKKFNIDVIVAEFLSNGSLDPDELADLEVTDDDLKQLREKYNEENLLKRYNDIAFQHALDPLYKGVSIGVALRDEAMREELYDNAKSEIEIAGLDGLVFLNDVAFYASQVLLKHDNDIREQLIFTLDQNKSVDQQAYNWQALASDVRANRFWGHNDNLDMSEAEEAIKKIEKKTGKPFEYLDPADPNGERMLHDPLHAQLFIGWYDYVMSLRSRRTGSSNLSLFSDDLIFVNKSDFEEKYSVVYEQMKENLEFARKNNLIKPTLAEQYPDLAAASVSNSKLDAFDLLKEKSALTIDQIKEIEKHFGVTETGELANQDLLAKIVDFAKTTGKSQKPEGIIDELNADIQQVIKNAGYDVALIQAETSVNYYQNRINLFDKHIKEAQDALDAGISDAQLREEKEAEIKHYQKLMFGASRRLSAVEDVIKNIQQSSSNTNSNAFNSYAQAGTGAHATTPAFDPAKDAIPDPKSAESIALLKVEIEHKNAVDALEKATKAAEGAKKAWEAEKEPSAKSKLALEMLAARKSQAKAQKDFVKAEKALEKAQEQYPEIHAYLVHINQQTADAKLALDDAEKALLEAGQANDDVLALIAAEHVNAAGAAYSAVRFVPADYNQQRIDAMKAAAEAEKNNKVTVNPDPAKVTTDSASNKGSKPVEDPKGQTVVAKKPKTSKTIQQNKTTQLEAILRLTGIDENLKIDGVHKDSLEVDDRVLQTAVNSYIKSKKLSNNNMDITSVNVVHTYFMGVLKDPKDTLLKDLINGIVDALDGNKSAQDIIAAKAALNMLGFRDKDGKLLELNGKVDKTTVHAYSAFRKQYSILGAFDSFKPTSTKNNAGGSLANNFQKAADQITEGHVITVEAKAGSGTVKTDIDPNLLTFANVTDEKGKVSYSFNHNERLTGLKSLIAGLEKFDTFDAKIGVVVRIASSKPYSLHVREENGKLQLHVLKGADKKDINVKAAYGQTPAALLDQAHDPKDFTGDKLKNLVKGMEIVSNAIDKAGQAAQDDVVVSFNPLTVPS